MPNPPPLPQNQLLIRLEILEERLGELENLVLDGKPTPKKETKVRLWMFVLTGVAIALALAPQNFTIGSLIYQTEGVPIEVFAAFIALYPTLEAIWLSLKKDS